MLYRVIRRRRSYPHWCRHSWTRYEVVAPVKRGAQLRRSRPSSSPRRDGRWPTTPRWHRRRRYFLPPTETLMRVTTRRPTRWPISQEEVRPARDLRRPRVRHQRHQPSGPACSATGVIPIPTIRPAAPPRSIVGVSCMPRFRLLLQSVGCRRGAFRLRPVPYDRLGDKFLVSISSVEAANILEAAVRPARCHRRGPYRVSPRHARASGCASIPRIPDIQDVAMLMDAFHSDPFWEELGGTVPGLQRLRRRVPDVLLLRYPATCSTPTVKPASVERIWDACTSPQFAVVAGGHNFRPTGRERVRHRMYHKLNGFLANARPHAVRGLRTLREGVQGRHQPHRGAEVLREEGGRRCHG